METRRLGRTKHHSSIAVFGAAALAGADEEAAGRALDLVLSRGVNHIDVAPRYGNAEAVLGPHLPAVRDRLFVACKTTRANPDGVAAQLEESLAKLGTDHFDLYQAHAVTSLDELERRAPALDRIMRARDDGLTRFAGITGHDMGAPAAFLAALRRWDLDTVMFPVYPRMWADAAYRADAEALLAECQTRDVGVLAIKAVARRPWRDNQPRPATTWYEPQTSPWAIDRGVRFALTTAGVDAICTPGDLELLPLALAATESFTPLSAQAWQDAIQATEDAVPIFPMPVG